MTPIITPFVRGFQFQYGTIKAIAYVRNTKCPCYFNSSMVRLKPISEIDSTAALYLFQFQYGTIKATNTVEAKKLAILFQFQYGTIKAMCRFLFINQ